MPSVRIPVRTYSFPSEDTVVSVAPFPSRDDVVVVRKEADD